MLLRFKIVNQTQVLVIEKFGKFDRIGESGVNILKFGEKVVADIDKRTQILSPNSQEVITSDSVILEMNAVVYFKVIDVMKAAYSVQDYKMAMLLLVETSMRNEIAKMKMEEALSKKDQINANLAITLEESTSEWGLKVERVEIRELKPSKRMAEAMEQERVAELERKAKVAEAKGEYDKEVTEAEGRKQSRVLNATAEKEEATEKAQSIRIMTDAEVSQIKLLAEARAEEIRILSEAEAVKAKLMLEALKEAGVDENVIRLKYIEALDQMAKGDNKVFFPYSDGMNIAELSIMSEVLNKEGTK